MALLFVLSADSSSNLPQPLPAECAFLRTAETLLLCLPAALLLWLVRLSR